MAPTRSLAWRPLAVLLLLALVAEVLVDAAKPRALTSVVGTALIAQLEYPGDSHATILTLQLANGSVVRTDGADEDTLSHFYTGQKVNVTGVLNTTVPDPRMPPTLEVVSIEALERIPLAKANVTVVDHPNLRVNGQSAPIGGGFFQLPVTLHTPILSKFKVLIVLLQAKDDSGNTCPGVTTGLYTKEDMENALWGSREYTLVGMYNECTNGRTRLDAANSVVTDFVPIACSGYSSHGPWNMPGCQDADARGWMEYADQYLQNRGVNYSHFDFVTYLAPPSNAQCAWLAMAETGCAGNPSYQCRMWAHGWGWDSVAMYLHEYGHHLYLGHAGQRDKNGVWQEYGDESCAMGICCWVRCMNTPHAFQTGWLPVIEINDTSLSPGTTISLVLLPEQTDRGVRVTPTWANGSMPLFLGYRSTQGYNKDLNSIQDTQYGDRTNVYRSNVVDPKNSGTTEWLAGLNNVSTTYSDETTGLTFRYEGKEGAGARISICRYGGPEDLNSCCYGRDQDCNGLGGQDDPACASFMPQCSNFKFGWNLGTTNPNPGAPSKVDVAVSKSAWQAEKERGRRRRVAVTSPAPST